MYLLRGQIGGDILSVQAVFTVGHPRNADLDLSDGYQVERWEAFEKDGVSYIPAQYNIKTGEVIYQKGMIEPEPEPTPVEQAVQELKQAQLETDTAALDLDYRLTLLENGVKEGEI